MQETLTNIQIISRINRNSSARNSIRRYIPIITPIGILIIWQIIAILEIYPSFIIPPPRAVGETFVKVMQNGTLWKHTLVTLEEVIIGLLFGVMIGLLVGYLIAKNPLLEDLLSPLIVAMQSTPVVAYAPLLIIWFGSGTTSKIVTSATIVLFPILINTTVGIRAVPPHLRNVMRSLRASRMEMLMKLEIPSAMPILLGGLKTSATLAVIGAVVGEFVSAGKGLGSLVTLARNQYDTPLVLVTIITMALLAMSLYSAVSLLERRLLRWQRRMAK